MVVQPLGRRGLGMLLVACCALVSCAPGESTGTAPPSAGPSSAPAAAPPSSTGTAALPAYAREPGIATSADAPRRSGDPLGTWRARTAAGTVSITSTIDGSPQPALFAPPADPGGPLLVVAHSWSDDYSQELNIPFARWAEQVGWGYLQPNFRGRNDEPSATGSDLAVQDVVDAVDLAIASGGVDPGRVYVIGFSGGGMMSLLLAGRHPDRFAGAVSFVPIYDLAPWYAYNRDEHPDRAYAGQIRASCGGDPTVPGPAADSCAARSPAGVLPAAAAADVPVYLGAGINDDVVPPSDAVLAYNALADERDRLPPDAVSAARGGELAPGLEGMIAADSWFTGGDPAVLHARTSGNVTLVLFDGGHDLVYYPGLDWLARADAARR